MTTQVWSSLAIAGITFVLLGIGLVSSVMSLVRGNRNDILASVPLASEQEVTLASQGEVLIVIETPRTRMDYRVFQIQLVDRQTEQVVTMTYSLVTAQGAVYGVTTMQVPFGRMNARAGGYYVRIAGLQAGKDYSDHRLILSRPYMGRMALQIIGIVLCGVGMLLSVIWAAWRAGLLKPAQV
jgi:hypothetical protein